MNKAFSANSTKYVWNATRNLITPQFGLVNEVHIYYVAISSVIDTTHRTTTITLRRMRRGLINITTFGILRSYAYCVPIYSSSCIVQTVIW
jgi:hypothetical protein